jgi:MFS family permease
MMAALIGITLGSLEESGTVGSAWRWMFIVGALPAFLCVPVIRKLKEPESWQRARDDKKHLGSMRDLFTDPRWRRNSIVGMLLAFAGVVGLWGIGFFSFDLLRSVLDKTSLSAGEKTYWTGITSLLQNAGAFLGIYTFTHLTHRMGRRRTFALAFVAAMGATA